MRKAISFLMIVIIMLGCFSGVLSAADFSSPSVSEDSLLASDEKIGDINKCVYLPKEKKVVVSGTINHEVMVTHNGYNIALFSVPDDKTLYEVLSAPDAQPLASADISIKFEFEVDAKSNQERFSRYAVVIYNDKGDIKSIDEPKHAGVETDYSYDGDSRNVYKGISTEQTSVAADAGVGTAIVPVYLEKLLSSASTGYLYSIQGSYIYFDKAYVGEIDVKVKSLSAIGCRVYLQFLISNGSESGITLLNAPTGVAYALPDMTVDQSVNLIMAFTDFMCSRYDLSKDLGISGIILGSAVDGMYSGDDEASQAYVKNYAHYMVVVGTVARAVIPSVDIVVPFSDVNDYGVSQETMETSSSPAGMLDKICGFFDEYFADEFPFSTMIETASVPYGISDDSLAGGGFTAGEYGGINADNSKIYSSYIDILKTKYDNSPSSFMFVWNVPSDVSGNVLSCAYAYSYFKLMSNDKLSAFVVSFSEAEKSGNYGGLNEIAETMKYIDTVDSFKITEPQLKMLGASNWYAVIDDMYGGRFDIRRILELKLLEKMPSSIIGNYDYYDFSYYTSVAGWFGGSFCDSLKIDYSDISGKSLQAHFSGVVNFPGEFSELYCRYEYPENFVYTPYMSLKFDIENDLNDHGSLYEVKLTFGSGKNVTEVSQICRAYEKVNIIFDISEYSQVSMADYVKIGVRCLTGDECGYKICIASMSGYSEQYVSDELESLISEERLRIRDMLQETDDDGDEEENTLLVIAGIAIVVAVIGVGIFMCFKREEED